MKNPFNTIISVGIALAVAGIGALIGLTLGPALIVGALAGIVTSVLLQRRMEKASESLHVFDDPADVEAAVQSVAQAALEFRTRSANISDVVAADLAARLNQEFSRMAHTVESPARRSAAPLLLDQVLEPATALMTDYSFLQQRGGLGTADMMRKIAASDLPKIEIAARQANAVMDRPGVLDMDALRRAVGFTLDESDMGLVTDPSSWGNRQRVVERANREESS